MSRIAGVAVMRDDEILAALRQFVREELAGLSPGYPSHTCAPSSEWTFKPPAPPSPPIPHLYTQLDPLPVTPEAIAEYVAARVERALSPLASDPAAKQLVRWAGALIKSNAAHAIHKAQVGVLPVDPMGWNRLYEGQTVSDHGCIQTDNPGNHQHGGRK